MTDIEVIEIPTEVTRLEDEYRFYETTEKENETYQFGFSDIIGCKIYDTVDQIPVSGSYTFSDFDETGGFTYSGGSVTIPKRSRYYISSYIDIDHTPGSGNMPSFTLLTNELGSDITMQSYFNTALGKKCNSNLVLLDKGQSILLSCYHRFGSSGDLLYGFINRTRASITITEINSTLINYDRFTN